MRTAAHAFGEKVSDRIPSRIEQDGILATLKALPEITAADVFALARASRTSVRVVADLALLIGIEIVTVTSLDVDGSEQHYIVEVKRPEKDTFKDDILNELVKLEESLKAQYAEKLAKLSEQRAQDLEVLEELEREVRLRDQQAARWKAKAEEALVAVKKLRQQTRSEREELDQMAYAVGAAKRREREATIRANRLKESNVRLRGDVLALKKQTERLLEALRGSEEDLRLCRDSPKTCA